MQLIGKRFAAPAFWRIISHLKCSSAHAWWDAAEVAARTDLIFVLMNVDESLLCLINRSGIHSSSGGLCGTGDLCGSRSCHRWCLNRGRSVAGGVRIDPHGIEGAVVDNLTSLA